MCIYTFIYEYMQGAFTMWQFNCIIKLTLNENKRRENPDMSADVIGNT